jgi:hypothetical protein
MPVTTRSQTTLTVSEREAATALLQLRSSLRVQSRVQQLQRRPERQAARTARQLIRLSVEALNED